ncbi:MAG: restriction endonuclease subunit S [Thermoanaerobaculia bacterium]
MTGWPVSSLGEVLKLRRDFIQIDDLKEYTRPRVQLHAQGIVVRDRVPGAMIKTKKQQVCRAGEFLVAEIDAKVGGFGLVPPELEGAIVSSHYFLFEVDERRLDRRFLDYFSRTRAFRDQVEAQGSTNYAAIRPAEVLDYRIPLPPLPEQRRVVARIEEVAGLVAEARRLRSLSRLEQEALVVSLHYKLSGERRRRLGDLLRLDEESVGVDTQASYPQVGVRSFGGGLFPKASVEGGGTTYKHFNRLYDGSLVLSQVKAWEGAVAVCSPALAGWFVSPEYRTFRCIEAEANPGYLAPLVRTEWFWRKLGAATRGVGARRERTRPEQFLSIVLPMPSLDLQLEAVRIVAELTPAKDLQSESAATLDALLPAVLDRAFRGEL